MEETPKFEMVFVTRKRRSRPEAGEADRSREVPEDPAAQPEGRSEDPAARPEGSSAGNPGPEAREAGSSGHHHRHYSDYGSLNLGTMPAGGPQRESPAPRGNPDIRPQPARSDCEPLLDRRFRSRPELGKPRLYLLVGLLVLAVLVGCLLLLNTPPKDQTEPRVETIPVLDLDDLP